MGISHPADAVRPCEGDVGRGCGSPVETSAYGSMQKHRPSRQARPCSRRFLSVQILRALREAPLRGVRCFVHRRDSPGSLSAGERSSPLRGLCIAVGFAKNSTVLGAPRCGCPVDTSKRSLEAPTEPAGENADPYEGCASPLGLCKVQLCALFSCPL